MNSVISLQAALWACASVLAAATLAPFLQSKQTMQRSILCGLLATSGLLAVIAGFSGLLSGGGSIVLPLGLPWLPMHLRLDALGSFFMLVIGALVLPVALYSQGYLSHEKRLTPVTIQHIS